REGDRTRRHGGRRRQAPRHDGRVPGLASDPVHASRLVARGLHHRRDADVVDRVRQQVCDPVRAVPRHRRALLRLLRRGADPLVSRPHGRMRADGEAVVRAWTFLWAAALLFARTASPAFYFSLGGSLFSANGAVEAVLLLLTALLVVRPSGFGGLDALAILHLVL